MAQFRVRARVLDLLGEEQIADLPTAISELFKNAYDAYANEAKLDIYPDTNCAVVWDDGFGMSEFDLEERWLVVGTPGKKLKRPPVPEGRMPRPVMGEKGIGRLAISRIGSTLLLVTRKPVQDWLPLPADDAEAAARAARLKGKGPFTALFLDWNIAKNPALLLEELEIPIVNFDALEDLESGVVDDMVQTFKHTLVAPEMASRWDGFDELRDQILEACDAFRFDPLLMRRTAVARKTSGTTLIMGTLHEDLSVYVAEGRLDRDTHEQDQVLQLLSNYTDRFSLRDSDLADEEERLVDPFSTDIRRWKGDQRAPVSLFKEAEIFSPDDLETYDHLIRVDFDAYGRASGVIERFDETFLLEADEDAGLARPLACGPFSLTLWYWQGNLEDSTLSPEDHAKYRERAKRWGGLMMYRSGLRVLPYGRYSHDWLSIEESRSRSAKDAFFSLRRLFGYVSIDVYDNPNLRDKAGREGLINNAAYRALRDRLKEFLKSTTFQYFRKNEGFEAQRKRNANRTSIKSKAKVQARKRTRALTKALEESRTITQTIGQTLDTLWDRLFARLGEAPSADTAHEVLTEFNRRAQALRKAMQLPSPRGQDADLIQSFADQESAIEAAVREIDAARDDLVSELARHWPSTEAEVYWKRELQTTRMRLGRIYSKANKEIDRIAKQFAEQLEEHREASLASLSRDAEHAISTEELSARLALLEERATRADNEAESLATRITQYLKDFFEEDARLRGEAISELYAAELARLDAEQMDTLHLAQAGLAAEIADHDLAQSYHGIKTQIATLRAMLKRSKIATQRLNDLAGYFNHLEMQYRQLQPLYRARRQNREWVTGQDIARFLEALIGETVRKNGVRLTTTDAFLAFRVFESTSLTMPVFINLVDNAIYWVRKSKQRRIVLDVVGQVVTVGDSGPGIAEGMREVIFERFVSTKPRGRGLGLYVSRQVLRASKHDLWVAFEEPYRRLTGACFCIKFSEKALSGGA